MCTVKYNSLLKIIVNVLNTLNLIKSLLSIPIQDYPQQVVGIDLCEHKGVQYLVTVDYYSHYPDIYKLKSATSAMIISIQVNVCRTGNGIVTMDHSLSPMRFAGMYAFQHIASSPRYPESNVEAEHMAKMLKGILQSSKDPHLAVLSYRATLMPGEGIVLKY